MRLYLAGPMSGQPRWGFDAFEEAAFELRFAGYDVWSPAEADLAAGFNPDAPADYFTPERYRDTLVTDLHIVAYECDAVAVLPGWEGSPGACAEVALARALHHPVHDVDYWCRS